MFYLTDIIAINRPPRCLIKIFIDTIVSHRYCLKKIKDGNSRQAQNIAVTTTALNKRLRY